MGSNDPLKSEPPEVEEQKEMKILPIGKPFIPMSKRKISTEVQIEPWSLQRPAKERE